MTEPIEQRLSYLGFRLIAPPPVLREYVQSFWVIRSDVPLTAPRQEFMHPGGGFGLVFNLGDALRLNDQPVADRMFLDGINTASQRMGFEGSVHAVGVRFHPGGAFPFLSVPLHELANETLALDVLGKRLTTPLIEAVFDVDHVDAQIAGMAAWLIKRLMAYGQDMALVRASLRAIRAAQGQVIVPQIAESLHIGQRQLERLYQTHVGITPKQYARLLRVEAAREALKVSAESHAQISAALGFYDQAHFIREFKSVVGLTPMQYAAQKRHEPMD